MRRAFLIAFWSCVILAFAVSAFADEPVCAERARMTDALITSWGELPAAVGRTGDNDVVEFWLHPETGTWTLLVTSPTGTSCIGAAGTEGQRVEENERLS